MLSLKELRQIEPNFREIDDESLIKIRAKFYELVDLALDACTKEKSPRSHDFNRLG